ncbi:MAG: putative toxin-antitoxin system toxin component, PIN family [Acidobacteria bacterium]|nr:putative toxin-antitoxin system toxin component, PIN family [Acidobacteriota bacterium]
MRVVLDTDVIVAAMPSPSGASAAILDLLEQGIGTMVLTTALAMEYESICQQAEHRLASGFSSRRADVFVNTLIALSEPVTVHYLWRPALKDPGDEMVLEAAINGRADALVTFNHRHYGDAPSRFGIELLLPRDALKRMKI